MDSLALKFLWLLILFVITVIFGALPSFLLPYFKNDAQRVRILSLCNSFAGGVFLGGGFVHLLPEATNQMNEVGLSLLGLPLSYVLCVCGFMVVFLIEKVLFLQDQATSEVELSSLNAHSNSHSNGHEHKHKASRKNSHDEDSLLRSAVESPIVRRGSVSEAADTATVQLEEGTYADMSSVQRKSHNSHTIEVSSEAVEHDHTHGMFNEENHKSPYLPYILMIVLSIHSIIAGVAIGVNSSNSLINTLGIAIVSHKWTESFAFGVSLLKFLPTAAETSTPSEGITLSPRRRNAKMLKMMAAYSCMVPLGIVIGSILSIILQGRAAAVIEALVGGVASGTFIYIALVDILLAEFESAKDKYWKYLLCIVGFVVILTSIVLFKDE